MDQSVFGYEIDVLAVGDGEKNGDAIAIRFGTFGAYQVLIYDGGTKDSGAALVEHVKTHYQTSRVDYVVNSHPDRDHASGLSVVLEELEVGELWMHQPWDYSDEICHYFHDGRITDNSLAERLKEKMTAAYELEKLAEAKGIPVYEPFAGAVIGGYFQILSPTRDWYVHTLIPEFNKSPQQKLMESASNESIGFGEFFRGIAQKAIQWINEDWWEETLKDDVSTSAENESSVILYASFADRGILLTGDAGIRALDAAATYAESQLINLPSKITFAQIPHHGSRHNVSTPVMNRVFGNICSQENAPRRHAIASVGKKCESHPRKVVSNAFVRRGFKVNKTKGMSIRYPFNMPSRNGWNVAPESILFSSEVEA